MTHGDMAYFCDRLEALFPGKLNDEQLDQWRQRLKGLRFEDCSVSLSHYYAAPKSPSDGAQPSIAGFMRHYAARCPAQEGGQAGQQEDVTTFWGRIRQRWQKGSPDRAQQIGMMTDNEVEAHCCMLEYQRTFKFSGSNARGTVGRYWLWQLAQLRIGRRASWPEELTKRAQGRQIYRTGWSEDAERIYLEETKTPVPN